MRKSVLLLILFTSCLVMAQDDFGIKVGGYVKTDIILDSRKNVTAREGHFLLYPRNIEYDGSGADINEARSLSMLAIQSRLSGSITAPDAFGAKTTGKIEGSFFGNTDGDINGFRLRHAYLNLAWENAELLIGQYWHPVFIPEVCPATASFNSGVPFFPFSRSPQVRFTYKVSDVSLMAAVASQRDFSSTGPEGSSSDYLRNSSLPIFNLKIQYKNESFLAGIAGDYKRLSPRQVTEQNIKTDEYVEGYSGVVFSRLDYAGFTIKAEGIYGQNMYDMIMLGGYAVTAIDPVTGAYTYNTLDVVSGYLDISYGKTYGAGVFAGYSKTLGSKNEIVGDIYGRGADIEFIHRISPRLFYKTGNTMFEAEMEMTTAAYGVPDSYAKVTGGETVTNVRLLLASYYYF